MYETNTSKKNKRFPSFVTTPYNRLTFQIISNPTGEMICLLKTSKLLQKNNNNYYYYSTFTQTKILSLRILSHMVRIVDLITWENNRFFQFRNWPDHQPKLDHRSVSLSEIIPIFSCTSISSGFDQMYFELHFGDTLW